MGSKSICRYTLSANDLHFATLELLVERPTGTSTLEGGLTAAFSGDVSEGRRRTASEMVKLIDTAIGDKAIAPESAFVVAVSILGDDIETCVAGPHRVHLLDAGNHIVASTREHILEFDTEAAPSFAPYRRYGDELIITRSIGAGASAPGAESTRWNHRGPYTIVICSTDYHFNRPPESYLAASLANTKQHNPAGSFATIKRTR